LKRTGDRVAAFVSQDGQTWASPSTPAFELPLPKVVFVGVALSSAPEGSFEARSTATFKNLSGLPLEANDSTSEPTASPPISGYCELRLYTVTSHKLDGVLERFRDTVEPVRRKHGITTIGYWSAPGSTNGGTFAYLMAAASKEELQEREMAFGADPRFKEGYAASNKKHGKTVDKIASLAMPTDATAKFDFTTSKTPRAFDLRIYSVLPGKLEAFRKRWRDFAVPIYARHGLHSVGWWVVEKLDAEGNAQFICLLAGESIEAIQKAIAAFHQDAEWQRVEKDTEKDGKLRSGVTAFKLMPADFSSLK
jgi:hypothetical protein